MSRIHMVDRKDQIRWFIEESTASVFSLQIKDNHRQIRQWLENMTKGVVVISAQGEMPRIGMEDHPYHKLFYHVQRDQFKIYFEDADDAMTFKLAWGGSCDV